MNRSKITLAVLLVIYLIAGMASCTKKQEADTPYKKVQGKWKLAKTASDGGGSQFIYEPVVTEQDYELTFNSNSTGVENDVYNTVLPPQAFSWKIIAGDSLWIAKSAHDTTTYYIQNLNSSVMTLVWYDSTSIQKLSKNGKMYVKK